MTASSIAVAGPTLARPAVLALLAPWWLPLVASIIFGVGVAVAYANVEGTFATPDEASNYAIARELVTRGRPWLDLPAEIPDEHQMLHPRAFVTRGDRAVPIQPLVTSALHALGWELTGSYAVSVGVLTGLGFLGWVVCVSLVTSARPGVALAAVVVNAPILFWLSRQFFTASTYLVLMPWALIALVLAARRSSWRWAAASGILHGLALSARPDFIFAHAAAVLGAILFIYLKGSFRPHLRTGVVSLLAGGLMFSLVVFGTNAWLLGSPARFGYDVARTNPGFDQPLTLGLPVVDSLSSRLFPFGAPSVTTSTDMAGRYLGQLTPVLAALAGIGLVLKVRAQKDWRSRAAIVAAVSGFFVYVVLSRSSLSVQGAGDGPPTITHGLVRYFLPIYSLMLFATAAGVSFVVAHRLRGLRLAGIALVVLGVYISLFQALIAYPNSVIPWALRGNQRHEFAVTVIENRTEPHAVVVSTPEDSLAVAAGRYSLSWWTVGENEGFRPLEVASTIGALQDAGVPVYLLDTFGAGTSHEFLREMCSRSLWFEQVAYYLSRVVPSDTCEDELSRMGQYPLGP